MEHIKRLIILGDNILDTVNSAVQCENYRMLSHDIREQANFFFGKETTYTNYSKSYSENDKAETTYFNMKKPASRRVIVVIALMITITVISTIASVTIGLTGFLLDCSFSTFDCCCIFLYLFPYIGNEKVKTDRVV